MRKKADWLDILVQFASFAAMIMVFTLAKFGLPIKIVLAFGISLAISGSWSYYKRKTARRASDPKRLHVYSVKNVDEK